MIINITFSQYLVSMVRIEYILGSTSVTLALQQFSIFCAALCLLWPYKYPDKQVSGWQNNLLYEEHSPGLPSQKYVFLQIPELYFLVLLLQDSAELFTTLEQGQHIR